LQQWQAWVQQDTSADLLCGEFEALRVLAQRPIERLVEPLSRLALQLSPEQLEHLGRQQQKSNDTFEKDFLRGSAAQRLDKRLQRLTDRYESLYGSLSERQLELIRASVQQSPFDPVRTQAERIRRQTDLQASIRQWQAGTPAAAPASVRGYVQRVMASPTPGYDNYLASLVRHGCAEFSALHNSTDAAQRTHALGVLQGYEEDLRALARER